MIVIKKVKPKTCSFCRAKKRVTVRSGRVLICSDCIVECVNIFAANVYTVEGVK